MQGGTFADDHRLYISCGYYEHSHPSWGIHLFDLRTQRRIVRSTNGSGSFNFEFHPGGSTDEEPEGLTYWDLDGRRVPGIQGQPMRSCSTTTRTATTCTSSTIESRGSEPREDQLSQGAARRPGRSVVDPPEGLHPRERLIRGWAGAGDGRPAVAMPRSVFLTRRARRAELTVKYSALAVPRRAEIASAISVASLHCSR